AAQKLIDLANEAGGPDNITVSIFRIDEMADAAPEVLAKLQLLKTQPKPDQPTPIVARPAERPSLSAPNPPEPIFTNENAAPPKPPARSRNRAVLWTLRIAAVFLVIAFSAAAWDFTLGPFAQSRVVAARVSNDIARFGLISNRSHLI